MHSKVILGTHFLAGKADCGQTFAGRRRRAGFTGAVERSSAFSRSAVASPTSNLNRRDHTNTATGSIAVVDGKQSIETLRAVADGV